MKNSMSRALSVLVCALCFAVPASAATYDFSNLGTASGGFRPQGGRFLVSDAFTQDGTSMYYDDSAATVSGMVIKPDGLNLVSFDLGNMTISPWGGSYTVSVTVTADLLAGGTTSQSVTNYSLTAQTTLTTMGMNFAAFNDVTELRIDMTVSGSNVYNIDFDDITITDEQGPAGTEPTTQATNLAVASTDAAQMNIYWQSGDGAQRIVFVKQGSSGVPTVTDGTVYTANSDFSSAADIGGGWKCVYRDTGRVASITGLAANTQYRVVVYEFNGAPGNENYLTTTGTNIINGTTSPAGLDKRDFSSLGAASGGFKPQGNRYLVSESFTNDDTSMYYDDSGSSVTGMVIKPNNTTLMSFDLKDLELTPFDADRTITVTVTADLKAGGTASQTVSGFTMYQGLPYSLALMGMDFSAFVGVTELRFDISTDQVYNINFSNITIANPDEYVVGTEPTTQATNLKIASTTTTSMDTYWTNGNGSNRVMFMKAGSSGSPTVTDGTVYTADSDFSAATDIGGGWKCVYRGIGNHTTITGLTAGTAYRLVVYEFDGAGGGEDYLTSTGTNIINHPTDPPSLVKYDFSALGAASGGFKPQGNRFLVSDTFTNDGTSMYYDSSSETVTGIVIKPDGTNLSSLNLKDMELSPFGADRTVSMTITADLSGGGTATQTFSNFTMYEGLSYSLELLGVDFSSFVDVTELRFDITVAGSSVNTLNFDNITISTNHSVTYNGNGNTGGVVPVDGNSYASGDTVTVLGNSGSLIRTGYTFAGWNTAANGSGTSYTGGDTFAMGSTDVTLYAQWAAVNYSVAYDGNTATGGAVPVDGTAYHITDTVTVLGNTGGLVKTGSTFSGWNTAANGSGTDYNGGDTFAMGSSNVTLYAQWMVNPTADLAVSKTSSAGSVAAGSGAGNLTYTVTITNSGPDDATGVTVSESLTLPSGVTVDSVTPSVGSISGSSPGYTWDLGTLANGGTATLTVTLTVDSTTTPGTDVISDTATVTAVNEDDTNDTNDSATEATSVTAPASVSAAKTVTGDMTPGGTVTYTVVLSNAGPADATDNQAVDEFVDGLPAGLTLVSASATSGTAAADTGTNTVTWNGTIPAGGSVTVTITATVGDLGEGALVSNQGEARYDADGDGMQEATALTDDPGATSPDDATVFAVGKAPGIPAASPAGLAFFAVLLALSGAVLVRRRLVRE